MSGVTVIAAMAALFLVGGGPFTSIAAGTIAVVAIAVAGSLTVLPGLLAWLGPHADADGSRSSAGGGPPPARRGVGGAGPRVVARPVVWGGLAAIALLTLAAPALGLRIGEPPIDAPYSAGGADNDAIQQAFPQAPRRPRWW